jgi:hypothetical protein
MLPLPQLLLAHCNLELHLCRPWRAIHVRAALDTQWEQALHDLRPGLRKQAAPVNSSAKTGWTLARQTDRSFDTKW